jgi:hypothetical protein
MRIVPPRMLTRPPTVRRHPGVGLAGHEQRLEDARVDHAEGRPDALAIELHGAGVVERVDDGDLVRPGGIAPVALPQPLSARSVPSGAFEHGLDDAADAIGCL